MTERDRSTWAAQVVDQDDDGLLVILPDAQGHARVTFAGGALRRVVGLAPEDLEGQPLGILRASGADPLDLGRLLRAVASRQRTRLVLDLEGPAGTRRVRLLGRPLAGSSGYLVRLAPDEPAAPGAGDGAPSTIELTEELVYRLSVAPNLALTLDWVGGAFTRVTGYRRDDLQALGGFDALVEPADQRLVRRRAQRLFAGEPASVEYRIRTRQGRRLWLRDRASPVFDVGGDLVVAIVGAARDISVEQALEARLAAQRQERHALSELSDGFVLAVDESGRLRDVRGELPGELGRRLRAAVGRPLDHVLGPASGGLWREQARALLPGWPPVRFALDFPTSVGEEHYQVAMAPGPGRTILAVLRPHTATLRLVPALAGEDAGDPRLRALIESLSEPSLLLAPDFRIQTINTAVERLIGWSRARAEDTYFPELLATADEQLPVRDDLARALAGTLVAGSETWVRLPGGQEGRVLWSFHPLHGAGGEVIAILAQGEPLAPLESTVATTTGGQPRLDLIIDHIADGVLTVDQNGVVVGFSRSAEAIFGYAESEIIGSRIGRLIVSAGAEGEEAWTTIVQITRRPGEAGALSGRRKSGEVIPIEVAASEVRSNADPIYVLTVRNVTLRRQTEETIRSLAYHDPLTGLPNRLLFHDRLHQAIERARRNEQVIAVMILDVDRFKLINDSLGLATGDRVLRRIGERLAQAVRRSDTVARLGGDDFLLLLQAVRSAENAAKVAQKLLDAVRPLLTVNGQELHLDASVGIALYPHDGEDPETLVRNADTALYRAKERSRGSYQFYTTDMNATAFERLILETQLRKAIENDELMVQYQPQLRIETGEVVGVEALVRWRHPELGMISPAEFIPLAEETGLIAPIGRFVLETACAEVQSWRAAGLRDLRLAVNLSGRQFEDANLVELIADVLRKTGFDPEDLELELTESSIMRDAEATIGKLEALDRLGIRLSIDDFGTGYSSLSYLKRFPIKALKIDQSFIQDITTDPNDAAIAQAIIALAGSMKLRVIAEGVETPQQLELLRRYRCDEMQGYLFSRPLPPDQLLTFLDRCGRMVH